MQRWPVLSWPRRATAMCATATATLLLVLFTATGGLAAPVSEKPPHTPPKGHRKPPVAPRPSYWGAWIGDQLTGGKPPWDMSAVSRLEGMIGKGLSLLALSSPFADCSRLLCSFFAFPSEAMENARAYGAIPFLNWSSEESSSKPNVTDMPNFQLSDVISGRYDSYIRSFAEEAHRWGHPFFLRFDWEMNGNWFAWGAGVNSNQPGEFVAAWRHVHDIFTSVGATNVSWVWCPYAEVKRQFAPLRPLYPGNRYVDWTCLDGYNWGPNPTNPHPWRSFAEIFGPTYSKIVKRIAPHKPMILAEIASTGSDHAKARWIREMFKQLRTNFRRIRGLIWFDQVDRGINWPLETSAAVTHAFSKGIRNPAFRSNSEAQASASPIPPPLQPG